MEPEKPGRLSGARAADHRERPQSRQWACAGHFRRILRRQSASRAASEAALPRSAAKDDGARSCRVRSRIADPLGTMILEPAMITAQALFHMRRGLIGARIRVRGGALGVQCYLRVQVDGAFGAKPEAVARDRDVPGIPSVEILTHRLYEPVVDPPTQGVADVEVFS